MYKIEDIKTIHMEVTERCNLSCLQCDRNENGEKVNPYLKDRELYVKDIKRTFSPEFVKQLNRMYMCGNYGDPACARDTISIFRYFKENNNISLSMNTNGSIRSVKWWEELAQFATVRFSIDGLSSTNHLYRQGANWSKIIKNVSAFISAGGNAIWDYIIFGHNEHQVEKAKELSEQMGFQQFVIKKTGRFFSNIKLEGKEEHCGLTKPKLEQNVNKSLKKQAEITNKYGSMENYLDQVEIKCKVLKNREIYISAEGIVLPCCWLAGQMYKWYLPPNSSDVWQFIDKERLSIKKNTLEEIFKSGIFDKIKSSWFKPTVQEGKLRTCALKCGKDFDQFGDQF